MIFKNLRQEEFSETLYFTALTCGSTVSLCFILKYLQAVLLLLSVLQLTFLPLCMVVYLTLGFLCNLSMLCVLTKELHILILFYISCGKLVFVCPYGCISHLKCCFLYRRALGHHQRLQFRRYQPGVIWISFLCHQHNYKQFTKNSVPSSTQGKWNPLVSPFSGWVTINNMQYKIVRKSFFRTKLIDMTFSS